MIHIGHGSIFYIGRIESIPRSTQLADSGVEGRLRTLRSGILDGLPAELRNRVMEETTALLAPVLRGENGR